MKLEKESVVFGGGIEFLFIVTMSSCFYANPFADVNRNI